MASSPEGAISNLQAEVSHVEGRRGIKDGRHKFTVYEHNPSGNPTPLLQGFHHVSEGKTVEGTGSGFAPDLGGAKNFIKPWSEMHGLHE